MKTRIVYKASLAVVTTCAGLASLFAGALPMAGLLLICALLVGMLPFGTVADGERITALDRELRLGRKADRLVVSAIGFVGARVSLVVVTGHERGAALTMWSDELDRSVGRSLRTSLRHQRADHDSANFRSGPLAKTPYL